ncbi:MULTISPECIES: hypothetical protein [unclassified Microcella]|uniref:PH-like domain-containing protein n=1 Tax=unclassified Microcella TaxID=2630066 RepID=UPI000700F3D4|nr:MULTISPECIES: hypothetical protein [unclassified Microcella]KQV24998.1 hypothetical protein ASC54_11040 [Yonghaparkia sp. Root332]KRF31283.1 hypothetical protein ASG83_10850 [Yonghaparkia sp. Soil809]
MDRGVSTAIIVAIILLALALMLLGWRRRAARQGDIGAPRPVPATIGEASIRVPVLYVATTRAGDPLDRVAVHGLGFRARGEVAVHPEGAVIAIDGREPWLVARADVRGSGRATWTIDRVVEEGGLVMLAWRLGDAEVDSYFRVTDARAIDATDELLAALATLAPSIPPEESPETPAPTERHPS